MAQNSGLIPVHVDWAEVVGQLYRRYRSYHAILNALADQGVIGDHSYLCYIRSGKRKNLSFELGAALLNLYGSHEELKQ